MMKNREYGLDLLKIMAMVFIVLDHILYWGGWGFCAERTGMKGVALETVDAVCLCHVNCFVLASGYIMSRLEFKFKRIVRLWLEVVGYSLAFMLLARLFFPSIQIGVKDVLKNLLPISSDRYWFFTQYFILFFTMPLLNSIIRNVDRKILVSALGIGFLCFSVHPFIFTMDTFHLNRGYSALWFMYLYLLSGTISVRGWCQNITRSRSALIALLSIGGCVTAFYLRQLFVTSGSSIFRADMFRAYNCPFISLYSVAMLLFFSKINVSSNRLKILLGEIAPSVFVVYVIHSNRLFRAMTNWNETWGAFLDGHPTGVGVAVPVISAALIFCGCVCIDFVRKRISRALYSFYSLIFT